MQLTELRNLKRGVVAVRRSELSLRFAFGHAFAFGAVMRDFQLHFQIRPLYGRRSVSLYESRQRESNDNAPLTYCLSDWLDEHDGIAVLSAKSRALLPAKFMLRNEICLPVSFNHEAYFRTHPHLLKTRLRNTEGTWQNGRLEMAFMHLQFRRKWLLNLTGFPHPIFISYDTGEWRDLSKDHRVSIEFDRSFSIDVNLPERCDSQAVSRSVGFLERAADILPQTLQDQQSDLSKIRAFREFYLGEID